MRLNSQVTFLGVKLFRLRPTYARKGVDFWRKDGVIVLRDSKDRYFTNQEKAFKAYNEYFHPNIAEGLLALGAVDVNAARKWKAESDQRARERAIKNDVSYLNMALKDLKLKPSAAQAKLLKKYGFK